MSTPSHVAMTERRLAEQVAQQLIGEGYDVLVEPGADRLPPDIARFHPDILARRGDEVVVVEVKARGTDTAARSQVEALARAVQSHPNWRFELVVMSTDQPALDAEPTWSRDQIVTRLAEARALAHAGHLEAALLILWAVCEATGRWLAQTENLEVQRWDAASLFRQLVHGGLLDGADLDAIEEVRRVRNRLVHGLNVDADLAVLTRRLADAVEHMLAEPARTDA
jgi:uncharacterized protein YutE (UPF0331/DUF86 family)